MTRSRRRRRTRTGPSLWLLATIAVAAFAWFVLGRSHSSPAAQTAPAKGSTRPRSALTAKTTPTTVTLVARRTGTLHAPVQDASIAALDSSHAMLLGGLTASDTSTDAVRLITARSDRPAGRLPTAMHDSAAAQVGGSVYFFGGGTATRQLDQIVRIGPGSQSLTVGRLPARSSDQAAAAVNGTVYVVGGYTGTKWLDTIVAWKPGGRAKVVAHLPTPVRYAAVAAAGGTLVVAGGSLLNGSASNAVLAYQPASGRVHQVGRLPAATTHAAAASLGGVVYVLGGRGATVGTPTARVVAVDARAGRVHPAGRLPQPLSDAAAAALGDRILVAGGKSARGTESSLLELTSRSTALAFIPHQSNRSPTLNLYAADGANMLRGAARTALPRVYVPNSDSNTVDVIDPRRFRVVSHFDVGALPQHVTPSWDLKTLYVVNDQGNSITPINPQTAKPGKPIPVADPYNLYFTPNGRYAVVVAERLNRLDFRNAHTFHLHHSLSVPCRGVDHMDFSAQGTYLIASCEFSGQMIKVDVARERVVRVLTLPGAGMPQDVKLSPDGRVFYVADMHANSLWEINGGNLRVMGFLRTGLGVHGLYVSRDATFLYATNRSEGTISVISFRTRKVVDKWRIPGGSPDMGNVSADGKVLWLSGRYNAEVYAISTRTGKLLARIPVGRSPHGLCVWPQPGRYSLGHTGILR